jgi:hypothetical protein
MKSQNYKIDELLKLTNRTVPEALDELCDRYNYFFLRTNGSYELPSYDGHINQTMKMLGELLLKWSEHRAARGIE